jgi:hypothetical protein
MGIVLNNAGNTMSDQPTSVLNVAADMSSEVVEHVGQ